MSKRERMSPQRLAEETAKAAVMPQANAVSHDQQKRAIDAMINGYTTRRFCIEQAISASQGKPWAPDDITDLVLKLFAFMSITNGQEAANSVDAKLKD